jgi:peptide/nickel transport system substrate-binding protein
MMKRTRAAAAASVLLVCSAAGAADLRIGLWDNPDAIDPTMGRLYSGRIILNMVCDKLFDITPDLKIVPVLATGHTISDDGKQMTIGIRKGVKFHDGDVMDAKAVKYTLERHIKMPGSMRKSELDVIDSVEVVDPQTVRLKLKQPSAPLLSHLTDRAGMIISPRAADSLGDKFGNQPVCTGPFKMTTRPARDQIILERFGDYWAKDRIHIDRVVLTPIPDGTVRVSNLRAGQLDLIERVSPQDVGSLKSASNIAMASIPELGYQVITFNVANGEKANTPLAKDARLREAFDLAIDRNVIAKVVFQGIFVPGSQYVSPSNFYFNPEIPVPKRDLAKARKLMAEAGHKRYPLTLMTANDPDWIQAAQIIQSMVAEAGFDMKIEVQENATRSKRMKAGDFDVGFSFWSGRSDPDGNIGNRAICDAPNNDSGYCNKLLDQLLRKAREAPKPEDRRPYYHKVTEMLVKDRPMIFVWHRSVITAFNKKVSGFAQYPDGLIRLQGMRVGGKP